jgi:hypothetical protein
MIACSPPLVNRSDGPRTHGSGCGLWIAAVSLLPVSHRVSTMGEGAEDRVVY